MGRDEGSLQGFGACPEPAGAPVFADERSPIVYGGAQMGPHASCVAANEVGP